MITRLLRADLRRLFLAKYALLAGVGAVLGLIASPPVTALRTGSAAPVPRHADRRRRFRLMISPLGVHSSLALGGALRPATILPLIVDAACTLTMIVPANALRTTRLDVLAPGDEWETIVVEHGDHAAFPLRYVAGRAPSEPTEIALSYAEADALQAKVGQQIHMRDGIARGLINKPAVVFGDEPTGALNTAASAQVLDLLGSVHADGTTLVLVTHDPAVAARAERVVVLVDGRISASAQLGRYADDQRTEREARMRKLVAAHGV